MRLDFDGTLARNDNPGHFAPPYPLGDPIPKMLKTVKSLLEVGVVVKIFTARACESKSIPAIQAWTEKCRLGRREVTNMKVYNLLRFFNDGTVPT